MSSIDAHVTILRTLAKIWYFCDCMHDLHIRNRIVLGIHDKQTRHRLLQDRKRTLKTCIDLCKSSEATSAQLKTISEAQSEDVHCVKDKHQPPKRHDSDWSKKSRELEPKTKSRRTCRFCVRAHAPWGAKCGGRNHEEATADHKRDLKNLLQRCLEHGIVLSPEKSKVPDMHGPEVWFSKSRGHHQYT